MRKVISKYSLSSSLTEHDIPIFYQIRRVGFSNDRLCAWVEHSADEEMRKNTVKVTFRIYHTDEVFDTNNDHRFLGTVLSENDFVFHIYEVRTKSKLIYSDEEQ